MTPPRPDLRAMTDPSTVRTWQPQQAHMPLLAVPYRPSWVEHLILSNRNILADQMEFLVSHLPRQRRAALA